MLPVVSKLNVKPHSNTHAPSHAQAQRRDHLTGHVNTCTSTLMSTRTAPTLGVRSTQTHRKSGGDPFLQELLFCSERQTSLGAVETYDMG